MDNKLLRRKLRSILTSSKSLFTVSLPPAIALQRSNWRAGHPRADSPRFLRSLNKNNGFTLVELLIVMSIVGALAVVGLLVYPSARKKASDANRIEDIKQYEVALESYANKNNGSFPNTGGSSTDLDGVCTTYLNTSNCPDNSGSLPKYRYYSSGGLVYIIWAQLEVPDLNGNTQFFVSCTSTLSGKTTTSPGYSTCPL